VEWFDPSSVIQHSDRVTNIFGCWPSFHDAEILQFDLSVADGKPWQLGSPSPVLEMQIHAFEMTKEVNAAGYFVLRHHTLVRLQFRNVHDLDFSNFSYQNAIFGLSFGLEPMSYPLGGGPLEGPPPKVITVMIDSSCGLSGKFKCQEAEVLFAGLCDENGSLLNPLS
jgi:hypothetical protein